MLLNNLKNGVIEAGCDEAGRGCLVGPVFAAAVILPDDFRSELLTDSKKLTEKQRYSLRPIIEASALAWAIGSYSNEEIDEVNILNASIFSMHRALTQLNLRPAHIIVDGNRFKSFENIEHTTVIKGDGKYLSIAAASILAKTYRDDFMNSINEQYPNYGWSQNKGYPTMQHREAIQRYGITSYHRKSFKLIDPQLSLDL
ncbi:MAG: ribonuclease HII [Bacteroidia bacterium]|nr:ribonuclease HII [Bacteroidia bacterium]